MAHEITYTRVGDYLLPDIKLKDSPILSTPLGRYGRMRRAFLEEHRPALYSALLLSERLYSHLWDVDTIAEDRRAKGVPESVIVKEIVCD